MLPIESVADMIVRTLAQQAVEKSIKAALGVPGVDFPFAHDIGGLARICNGAEAPSAG
jgi:HEPN domain-containing protein